MPIGRRETDVERVLREVGYELRRALELHAPMHSPHEGYAVIREELERELWEHVCADTGRSPEARAEAIQIAAMGLRYALDLCTLGPGPDCERCQLEAANPGAFRCADHSTSEVPRG